MSADTTDRVLRFPPWSFSRILIVPVVILVVLFAQPWLRPWELLVDPVQWIQNRPELEADGPPFYLGMLSTVGGLIWWTGAVACAFAGLLVRAAGDRRGGAYLLSAAAFTGLLGLDDLLLIHEGYIAHFHVPESVTLGAYGLYFLGHCYVFREEILASESGLLVLAVVLLGASAGIDVLGGETPFWGYTEEAFKFLGLFAWSAYHCRLAWTYARKYVRRGSVANSRTAS